MSGIRAGHFTITDWLKKVGDATAQLPEFQRDVVWDHKRASEFLDAVLQDRPIGCLLLLKVDQSGDAPFDPRPIQGAEPKSMASVKHLILDGQQRITAIWNALTGAQENRNYFIYYSGENHKVGKVLSASTRKFHESPKECFKRGLIPMPLLRLANKLEERKEVLQWIDQALVDEQGNVNAKERTELEAWISERSEQIRLFDIPHLAMPETTTETQAIDTFVKSNSSSINLKKFDIATAEALQSEHSNLRNARQRAWDEVVKLRQYIDLPTVGDLLLKVACLRTGHVPVESNYRNQKILEDITKNLDQIIAGIEWTIDLLQSDCVWDRRRLPTVVPFRVLPALYEFLPTKTRHRGPAQKTARAYLWRAFLTDRYKSSAATLLKEDYDGLREILQSSQNKNFDVPIWSRPLPTRQELEKSPWPTSNSSLSKALVAIALRRGALDIGTGEKVLERNLGDRQYHHIFPHAYLERRAPNVNPNLAMNCMLIRGQTNREASDKPPVDYLQSLVVSHAGSKISRRDLESRLESHLVPFDTLQLKRRSVKRTYEDFIETRAGLIVRDIENLANGNDPLSLDRATTKK